ncbi:MAG: MotA/TolQ/ExbB proton channel family protein [Deltaproteobacteria bacterium]|nr:MAG: MotA/TolQ/ExbB proton channel family protein [Deltaproteobacteria bacterium]
MLDLFFKGGPLMWPLLFCSVLALGLFFMKLIWFSRLKSLGDGLFRKVEGLVREGRYEEAAQLCRQQDHPLAQVLLAVLSRVGRPREQVKTVASEVASRESIALERYLGLLATIGTISPLLGLLGTVVGMIEAFNVIATAGVGTPQTLGGGISQALITTATGMAVAIPVILAHRFLVGQMNTLVAGLEESVLHIVDLVGE